MLADGNLVQKENCNSFHIPSSFLDWELASPTLLQFKLLLAGYQNIFLNLFLH